jgi:hypothetical protein
VRRQQAQTPPARSAARLFDLRVLIGALFTFYGIVLIITGLVAGAADERKAAGVDINLWMGLGMLVLGLLFLLWWRLRPLPAPADPGRTAGSARRARSERPQGR